MFAGSRLLLPVSTNFITITFSHFCANFLFLQNEHYILHHVINIAGCIWSNFTFPKTVSTFTVLSLTLSHRLDNFTFSKKKLYYMFYFKCTIFQQQSMCQGPKSQFPGLIILYSVQLECMEMHKTLTLKAHHTEIIQL